ncbi:Mediator of RNA polymerase II transcription subunit 22, partial [Galemys pyrenaicus]
ASVSGPAGPPSLRAVVAGPRGRATRRMAADRGRGRGRGTQAHSPSWWLQERERKGVVGNMYAPAEIARTGAARDVRFKATGAPAPRSGAGPGGGRGRARRGGAWRRETLEQWSGADPGGCFAAVPDQFKARLGRLPGRLGRLLDGLGRSWDHLHRRLDHLLRRAGQVRAASFSSDSPGPAWVRRPPDHLGLAGGRGREARAGARRARETPGAPGLGVCWAGARDPTPLGGGWRVGAAHSGWVPRPPPLPAGGPAMAQQRALPQSKETLLQSYNKRLKDDIKSIMDNFTEIIKTAKIEDETQVSRATQGEQDNYEMHVRAANIVRAGESLMKLVSDLKQFLILNDFPSVNEAIEQRTQQLRALQEECDRKLVALRDEVSVDLYELEEEYYSSSSSLCEASDLPLCEAYWRLDLDSDSADGLSAPLLLSPEPSTGPLQAAAPAHAHTGPGPTEHS